MSTQFHFLALALWALLAAPTVAAQSRVTVQNETAAGSGAFGPETGFDAFDGGALTADEYYNNGRIEFPNGTTATASYRGPEDTFMPPAIRYAELLADGINVFFVDAADGLTLFWVAGPSSFGPKRPEALHVLTQGAFVTPIAHQDDASDTFTFSNADTQLVNALSFGRRNTDGFATQLTTPDFVFDTELTTAGSVTDMTTWRVHRPDGAPIDIATELNRAVRFGGAGRTISVSDVTPSPGWRLLSAPVGGVTTDDLAAQNLVQGVPGADGVPGQFPDAQPNFFTGYNGGGRYDYIPAANTAIEIASGRGFWWYWYDAAFDPDDTIAGGGTSESVELDGFTLAATGPEIMTDVSASFMDNTNTASGSTSGVPNILPDYAPDGATMPADDDFYMIGNPYSVPVLVSGITATGGTLGDTFFSWNPGNPDGLDPEDPNPELDGPGSYELLFATPMPGQQAAAAVWQGLMAEVTTPTVLGGQVDFTIDRDAVTGAGDPPFHGKTGDAFVHFSLRGTTASGYTTRDEAAYVRFRTDASYDWDRFDASKPMPPVPSYAVIAPVGVRDGETKRQAVLSLPEGGATEVALAITANEPGTHTLSWDGSAVDALLTDTVTGETVWMRSTTSYTFDIEPTDWTERFTVAFASTVDASDAPIAGAFVGLPSPNPSAGAVRLDVRLDAAADATVSVYDVLGRRVSTATASLAAGVPQAVSVPTAGLAPGAYVVLVEAPGVRETRRVTVIR